MARQTLHRWHRKAGKLLGWMILAQALTGLAMVLATWAGPDTSHGHGPAGGEAELAVGAVFASLHHGGGLAGKLFRIVAAGVTLFMAATGYLMSFPASPRRQQ